MAKEKKILLSTLQVAVITIFIKFLGLIKQSILAAFCGANETTDIFFIATSLIINLCTVLFSAISISLLTMYTKRLEEKGRESANYLINAALKSFLLYGIVLLIIFMLFAEEISRFLAPAYTESQVTTLTKYIRIMSISFLLWAYFLTVNVVLETDKIFLPGKCQGFFQNVLLIISAVFLYKKYGIDSLIYSFLLSGLFECILVTWCTREKFKFLFIRTGEKQELLQLFKLSLPLIIGNAMYEINDIVDKQISTGIGEGSASVLNYGATVNEIVTGVIVASVSTVLFSHFASWVAAHEHEKIKTNLLLTLEYLTVLLIPIMVMCIVSGDQIVTILYGRGNFGSKEIMATSGVVLGYSAGFVFQAARANLVKVYYAFQNTKVPMVNGIISVGLNIILSIILSKYIGVTGIALATSIAMFVGTVLLLPGIKRMLPNISFNSWMIEFGKALLAGAVSAIGVYAIHSAVNGYVFFVFILEGIICVIFYMLVMGILKAKSVIDIIGLVKAKIH